MSEKVELGYLRMGMSLASPRWVEWGPGGGAGGRRGVRQVNLASSLNDVVLRKSDLANIEKFRRQVQYWIN